MLAVALGGCGTGVSGSSPSDTPVSLCGTGPTTSTTACISNQSPCPQIYAAIQLLAQVPFRLWNKPISHLSSDDQQKLTAAGVPLDQKASDAYVALVQGPEWAKC